MVQDEKEPTVDVEIPDEWIAAMESVKKSHLVSLEVADHLRTNMVETFGYTEEQATNMALLYLDGVIAVIAGGK